MITVLLYIVIVMHFGSWHFKLINEQTMKFNKKRTDFLHLLHFVKLINPRQWSYASCQSAAILQSIQRPLSHRSFNKSPWLRYFYDVFIYGLNHYLLVWLILLNFNFIFFAGLIFILISELMKIFIKICQ